MDKNSFVNKFSKEEFEAWKNKKDFKLKNKELFDILIQNILSEDDKKTLVYVYEDGRESKNRYLIESIIKTIITAKKSEEKGYVSFRDFGNIISLLEKRLFIHTLRHKPVYRSKVENKRFKYYLNLEKDKEYLVRQYEKNFGNIEIDSTIFFKIENKKYLDILFGYIKSPNKIVF